MFLSPRAPEVFGDLGGRFLAGGVPMLSKLKRFTFPVYDRANNGHPSCAGKVTDSAVDLHIHLIQGLLHPLNSLAAFCDQVAALSSKSPQTSDRLVWAKRAPKQAMTV